MADRYLAQIDGFVLEVEALEDGFEKAVARYEYPYRNGAQLEDMGQTARTIRIRCFFLEESYPDHFDLLEHMKQNDLFEMSHPKYGLIKGCIEAVTVRHDDRAETAEVDITFVQDLLSQEEAIVYQDVQSEAEEAFEAGQQELMDGFATQAREALGSDAGAILAQELDPGLGILEQFPSVGVKVRSWLKAVESFVTTLQAEAIAIANPANSLVAMISYGTQLPGRVIGALAQTVERYAILYESLKEAPERFLRNLKNSTDDLAGRVSSTGKSTGAAGSTYSSGNTTPAAEWASSFGNITRVAGAQRMGLETATIYADDEKQRDRQRRRESAGGSFDVLGNYLAPEQVSPVLSVRELEGSLALIRTVLQEGLDIDRSQQSLKTMARGLLDHVMVVKLERDRLVRIVLDNALPLHLVCLMRGLPYAYAERILAVNAIVHPNFTEGEIDVYA